MKSVVSTHYFVDVKISTDTIFQVFFLPVSFDKSHLPDHELSGMINT